MAKKQVKEVEKEVDDVEEKEEGEKAEGELDADMLDEVFDGDSFDDTDEF
jgi:hypothetical protein